MLGKDNKISQEQALDQSQDKLSQSKGNTDKHDDHQEEPGIETRRELINRMEESNTNRDSESPRIGPENQESCHELDFINTVKSLSNVRFLKK